MAKFIKNLATLVLATLPFFAAQATETHKYSDPLFPAKSLTLLVSDKQFAVADMAEDLYICDQDSEFYCARSKTLKLDIPKTIGNGQQEWVIEGRKYRIEAVEKYSLRGRTEELMRIRGESESSSNIFLYSLSRGIVGMGFVRTDDRSYTVYLLEGACGFGAPKSCSADPSR